MLFLSLSRSQINIFFFKGLIRSLGEVYSLNFVTKKLYDFAKGSKLMYSIFISQFSLLRVILSSVSKVILYKGCSRPCALLTPCECLQLFILPEALTAFQYENEDGFSFALV